MKQYATARFLSNALYFLGAVVTIGSLVLGVISLLVMKSVETYSIEQAKFAFSCYAIAFGSGVLVLLLSTLVLAVLDIAENSYEILARLRVADYNQPQ